ncbi:creatinine amidohydrolase [Fusobacterium naviforme]|nr:creatininase family protein [Fusobacterium naviforme]PSL10147.1 creatinine amidohydrolase [Fusobacterium naviforme]STO27556.1 Creatinine amidohydrolase [Fusobacterium naviforme]
MENHIRKLSGKKYLERIKNNPTVIIPTGACEVYGPQLPMGTDLLVAEKIAEILAEKTGALIAPTVEMGESSALAAFPCTFVLPRKILEDYLEALMDILIRDGAKNFVFITGHAGNVDTVSYLIKKHLDEGIKAIQIDWWRFTAANASDDIFDYAGPMCHGHASECGTSVMMYLYPDMVDHEEITCTQSRTNRFPDILQYGKFTEKTENGMIGDATVATREKGEKIVKRCVDRIMSCIQESF